MLGTASAGSGERRAAGYRARGARTSGHGGSPPQSQVSKCGLPCWRGRASRRTLMTAQLGLRSAWLLSTQGDLCTPTKHARRSMSVREPSVSRFSECRSSSFLCSAQRQAPDSPPGGSTANGSELCTRLQPMAVVAQHLHVAVCVLATEGQRAYVVHVPSGHHGQSARGTRVSSKGAGSSGHGGGSPRNRRRSVIVATA